MVVTIPDAGLVLESSAKAVAGLPTQAFAVSLSNSMIENMIECVKNGGDIQLSLGNSPAFLFDNQQVVIPNSLESFDYDIFVSNSPHPTTASRLPSPAMSLFKPFKLKPLPATTSKSSRMEKLAPKPKTSAPKLSALADKDLEGWEDEAVTNLKNSYAKAEAEKRGNASTIIDGVLPEPEKAAKTKAAKGKLLSAAPTASSRSHPSSPALSGIASPSLAPTTITPQDRLKQQRFPIIHELAVQDHTFNGLWSNYKEGTESEFSTALKKVADFDSDIQKWTLNRMYWKELDVFQYPYAREEDRQKAIDNAIKQYDRMRLGASDPLWQKLLPKAERNKGICLSKLQAMIANKASAPPKASTQKSESPSIGDSEKDDSASSGAKKGKGGEPMSRSGSQTSKTSKKKPSASEAQAKRMLSNNKKTTAATAAKPTPKTLPTKTTTAPKATGAKNGRVLSKEFITDSDSEDDDEVPLSNSMPKTKPVSSTANASAPKPVERPAEKAKVAERPKVLAAPKRKPAPAAKPPTKEMDTIRAQAAPNRAKAPVKRQRDPYDDDSSSSGTPLSKRLKPNAKTAPASSFKEMAASDASLHSRSTASGNSVTKNKDVSPPKSSPLAASPPTNASDLDEDRSAPAAEAPNSREGEWDSIVSRAGSSTSTGSSVVGDSSKKRPLDDSAPTSKAKRQRLGTDVLNMANRFKEFYVNYEKAHREIRDLRNPPKEKVELLLEMHNRLVEMKAHIYQAAPVGV
ncbi:hypothetical protein QBC47DRAFT_301341 [Echria macrotheca]|uniref:Uncharacterized protein n=1 Tax=Echria macrotheca TaxID=438768 RepID=A0AAJ0BB26_9PEZI|nr:hypothetical protein QBC47DRAFT_301341 [Echria macrotheca]